MKVADTQTRWKGHLKLSRRASQYLHEQIRYFWTREL